MTFQSGRQYSRLQQRILERHGFERSLTNSGKHKTIVPKEPGPVKKTLAMRLVEDSLGVLLEDVLFAGSEEDVAKRLGIARSTVSVWRKKLGVRKGWHWQKGGEAGDR